MLLMLLGNMLSVMYIQRLTKLQFSLKLRQRKIYSWTMQISPQKFHHHYNVSRHIQSQLPSLPHTNFLQQQLCKKLVYIFYFSTLFMKKIAVFAMMMEVVRRRRQSHSESGKNFRKSSIKRFSASITHHFITYLLFHISQYRNAAATCKVVPSVRMEKNEKSIFRMRSSQFNASLDFKREFLCEIQFKIT